MLTFLSLMFGTFVSEDLACITAGLLVRRGAVGAAPAVVACTFGIFLGDVGLWGLGRALGPAVLAWPWLGACLTSERGRQLSAWLYEHKGQAIVASRFLPGTRLPLYVAAGHIGISGRAFVGWAFFATLLWTPGLVLLTARLGDAFSVRISSIVGSGWIADGVVVALMLLILKARRLAAYRPTTLAEARHT